jgi:hypothetical protein
MLLGGHKNLSNLLSSSFIVNDPLNFSKHNLIGLILKPDPNIGQKTGLNSGRKNFVQRVDKF